MDTKPPPQESLNSLETENKKLQRRNRQLKQQISQLKDQLEEQLANRRPVATPLVVQRKPPLQAANRIEADWQISEARFRNLIEQSPFSTQIFAPDGRTTLINQAFINLWELTPEGVAFILENYNILEDEQLAAKGLLPTIKKGFAGEVLEIPIIKYELQETEFPSQFVTKSRWVTGFIYPVKDEAGNIREVVLMHHDVSERMEAQEALQENQRTLETLMSNLPGMAYRCLNVPDWTMEFVSKGCIALTEYQPEELIGSQAIGYGTLVHPADREMVWREVQTAVRDGRPFTITYRLYTRTGVEKWVWEQGYQVGVSPDRLAILEGFIIDVTERKQTEVQLERYARRLETLREIGQAILLAESMTAIAQAALKRLKESLPFFRGSVALFNFADGVVEILANLVSGKTEIGPGSLLPLHYFDVNETFLQGEIQVQADVLSSPTPSLIVQKLQAEGVRSYISVPLLSQEQFIGALYLGAEKPGVYTDEHVEIAREVAHPLAVAIQQARLNEQIQRHANELERHVAERTRDLMEANERLQDLDRLKSKFISDVSHELRTPVTNLIMYLDLMEKGSPENFARYRMVLREQTERLKVLVEDTLDLSRLDLMREAADFTAVNLNQVVEQVVAAHGNRAAVKGLSLEFVPDENLPSVWSDLQLLDKLASNLLLNAIDYTVEGGVTISTGRDTEAEQIVLRVQDTGVGLTAEEQEHCLDPFYRGERVGQLNIPGNGLGLTLVKQILDLHNGRIQVESTVDKGSTFTVWLPLPPP